MIKYLRNIFSQKCPRCYKGDMFTHKWYGFKKLTEMPEKCSECGQRTELEPSFYYGTAYVSYALTVAISVSTFVAWWVLIGISISDNSIFWWLGLNSILLIVLQPWLMRASRILWLSWFFHKDDDLFNEKKIANK